MTKKRAAVNIRLMGPEWGHRSMENRGSAHQDCQAVSAYLVTETNNGFQPCQKGLFTK